VVCHLRTLSRHAETGLEEISGDLREADFGEICDAAGVARHGREQFVRNTNISSTGLNDSPFMMLLGFSRDLPERGLQQMVSAPQCRPPEFGRRAAISFAERGAEMAVTGKAQVLA
jgi:hypothetical protein